MKDAVGEKNKAFSRWVKGRRGEMGEDYNRLKRKANRIMKQEKTEWLEKCTDLLKQKTVVEYRGKL